MTATHDRKQKRRLDQALAKMLRDGVSERELAPLLVRAGLEMSLRADGPAETIEGLARLLRQLAIEFPDGYEVARFRTNPAAAVAGSA
jgi:hypothetical protein